MKQFIRSKGLRISGALFALAIPVLYLVSQRYSDVVEIARRPVSPGALRIAYGDQDLQFGELRLPAGPGPHPVVLLVHGGCWVKQLKGIPPEAVAIDGMRSMAGALTAKGYATWNLEYRRLGHPGGGWPGSFQDVARGADHLRQLASQYPLDLKRVVVAGHSAGGHFALWLAGRHKVPAGSEIASKDPLRVKGVLNLDGPGDLAATAPLAPVICQAPVIEQLLGGTKAQQPARYRAASPIELLPLGVPQRAFAGMMFTMLAPSYEKAALAAGDNIKTLNDPKEGHFEWIDPASAKWPAVVAAIEELLGG